MAKTAKKRKTISDKPRRRIQSRSFFDAASTTRHNQKHWQFASDQDFDSLVRMDRATLCQRAVYEVANNGYAKGISNTLANDIVGTGPRLQLDSGNPEFDNECENRFMAWAKDCDFYRSLNLVEILRMAMATELVQRGESIIVFANDEQAGRNQIKLRIAIISAERLSNPYTIADSEKFHDGIMFDAVGRPDKYCILKSHPGSQWMSSSFDYDVYPASRVIHFFVVDHPGQTRGIPWITPSLPICANMRRFTLATVNAAETAANISGTIHTSDATIDESEDVESNDVIDIERNALLTLPAGYQASQFKPEQPVATYEMFKAELINELARPLNMPYNVAAANSKNYNYASGRLDHQEYDKNIRTIQRLGEAKILNRIFATWLQEAYFLPDFFDNKPAFDDVANAISSVQWFWTPRKHVDPVKEADAQSIKLRSGSTTLAEEYAEQGKDWQRETRQRIKELSFIIKIAQEEGVPLEMALPEYLKGKQDATVKQDKPDDTDEE